MARRDEGLTVVAESVDAFLDGVPQEARGVLDELRATLLSLVPDAVEKISYGVPAVVYRGRPLVGYAATATHRSLYVMSPAAIEALGPDLRGYDTSKGTIRFPARAPLPDSLLEAIVGARMAEVDAALTRRGRGGRR